MARKARTDRGLMQRKDAQGKLAWYVRLYHERKDRWFGSFPTKTKAREVSYRMAMYCTEKQFSAYKSLRTK